MHSVQQASVRGVSACTVTTTTATTPGVFSAESGNNRRPTPAGCVWRAWRADIVAPSGAGSQSRARDSSSQAKQGLACPALAPACARITASACGVPRGTAMHCAQEPMLGRRLAAAGVRLSCRCSVFGTRGRGGRGYRCIAGWTRSPARVARRYKEATLGCPDASIREQFTRSDK